MSAWINKQKGTMKTKEVTLCGKQVNLAYCYATEIGFNDIAEASIENIDTSNPKHILSLIMAAMLAYYEGKQEECTITNNELMFEAEPQEITAAFVAVLELRMAWYKLPAGEPKDETAASDEEQEKNA